MGTAGTAVIGFGGYVGTCCPGIGGAPGTRGLDWHRGDGGEPGAGAGGYVGVPPLGGASGESFGGETSGGGDGAVGHGAQRRRRRHLGEAGLACARYAETGPASSNRFLGVIATGMVCVCTW